MVGDPEDPVPRRGDPEWLDRGGLGPGVGSLSPMAEEEDTSWWAVTHQNLKLLGPIDY